MVKSLFSGDFSVIDTKSPMISIEYGKKDWVMSKGIAEVISNVFDTHTEYDIHWDNGIGYMIDNGAGIPKKAFYMGASSKGVDTDTIGMFGEGLKMAIVTAIRNNRTFSIQTVGYGVECVSNENDEIVGIQFLFTNNARSNGTEVRIECTEDEWKQACDMFIVLRNDYQHVDKNVYLPGGFVMCNGVQIEMHDNLLFSYDIKDKGSLNRDRNSVAARALSKNLPKLLSNIKSNEAVLTYINGLFSGEIYDEYRVPVSLSDKQKELWRDCIKAKYGENTIAASVDNAKNLKLAANGYTVLPCPTSEVRQLLTMIGLEKAMSVLRNLEKSDAVLKDSMLNADDREIEYPMSTDYSPKWTYIEAGREIVANGFDAGGNSPLDVHWENGKMFVIDSGNGIDAANLAFGNSCSRKSTDNIGMFGEGLKLAFLVMARENREMVVETVGRTYYPVIQRSKKLPLDVLVLKYDENKRKVGTSVSFTVSKSEYNAIRDLFICFKDNLDVVPTKSLDVILNESDAIYVQGLSVKKIVSMFAYNIKDKTAINNRDRNNVDDGILHERICDFYRLTTDKRIIEKYLVGWRTNPSFYEYTCNFDVYHISAWTEIIKKVFPKHCVSSYSRKSDFIATVAGYEVISDIPANVKEICRRVLPSSDSIALEYGDSGILLNNTITYPITSDYVYNWDAKKALVELLSNAIDADPNAAITENGNCITIKDNGGGLSRKNLFIGNSGSREKATAIGTFGEGLKLACLALARDGNPVVIETVGFNARASMQKNKLFDEDMLVIELSKNDKKSGTSVFAYPTRRQLETAGASNNESLILDVKKQFVAFSGNDAFDGEKNIFVKPGRIYVNGVYVTNMPSAAFSYNLTGDKKCLLNRDRSTISNERLSFEINSIFVLAKSEQLMEQFLTTPISNPIEAQNHYFGMKSDVKRIWLKVAKRVFKKCCIEDVDIEKTHQAKYMTDYKILNIMNTPPYVIELLRLIGFPTAISVMQKNYNKDAKSNVVDESELTISEMERWALVQNYVAKMFGDDELKHVYISKSIDEITGLSSASKTGLGVCINYSDIYILRSLLGDNYSLCDLIGVVEHEFSHKLSSSGDVTVNFESMLTKRLGILGEMITQHEN